MAGQGVGSSRLGCQVFVRLVDTPAGRVVVLDELKEVFGSLLINRSLSFQHGQHILGVHVVQSLIDAVVAADALALLVAAASATLVALAALVKGLI